MVNNNDDKRIEALLDAFANDSVDAADMTATNKEGEEWNADDVLFLQAVYAAANMKYGKATDVDGAWQSFQGRKAKPNTSRRIWKIVLMAAAAIVALMVMTFTLFGHRNADVAPLTAESQDMVEPAAQEGQSHEAATKPYTAAVKVNTMTAKTATCEIKTITLADGTEVTLNANSTLTYPDKFVGSVRRVVLKGEAYFKVAPDKRHPFILRSGDLTTKVLGTEFNVRGYNPKESHVTLVSGKVEVLAYGEKVKISPNQDVHLDGHDLEVADVNPKDFTSWRQGILYFDDATLYAILQQIGNWYGVNVVCRDGSLLSKRYHYMFHTTDSLEYVLELIKHSSEVEISLQGNTIYVE